MAKLNSNINTTQGPIPQIDPNRILGDSLKQQGLPVATSALDYARSNAVGDLPQNNQNTGSVQYDPNDPVNNYNPTTASDEVSWEDQPKQQPQYEDQGNPQLDFPDSQGRPRTVEEAERANIYNMQQQQERANAVGFDWSTPEELAAAFPRETREGNRPVIVPSERGKIVGVARELGSELSVMSSEVGHTDPSKSRYVVSGLQRLGQSFDLNPKQAAAMATTGFALTAPILSGASQVVDGEVADPDTAKYSSWGSVDNEPSASTVPMRAVAGGLTEDTLDNILGNNIIKLNRRGNTDANGNPLVPNAANISSKEAGAIVRQGLVNSGYLLEDKVEGEKVYRLSPILGMDFYQASKQMARDTVEHGRGRSQTVPVTDTGQYVGANRNSRGGDKKGSGYEPVPAVKEAQRISGSIALVFSPIRTFLNAIFTNQAINEVVPSRQDSKLGTPDPKSMVGQPMEGVASTAKLLGFTSDDTPDSFLAKATTMLKLSNYYGQNIVSNAPRFAQFFEDYSVHRMYNDTEDANVQRDKQTRAVVGGVRLPLNVSTTNWHNVALDRITAGKHFGAIQEQVSKGDMKLSETQREFAWLATIGKVLDVGKTVGKRTDELVIAEQASLVTPEFLRKAGYIGSVLASIVPQSTRGIAEVNLDLRKLKLQLDPTQLQVLNDFINNSKKKDWGYRLQAYLDVNNYLAAKKNGTAFNPQATLEIDMNSAGRMFLAFDSSNDDVLRRTGVLWEKTTDPIQSTQPSGNPRMLFVEQAAMAGIRQAISDDHPERIQAWQSILQDIAKSKDVEMADAFGKGVLLTTDYGKPKSYHFEEARKFLNRYPAIRDQLLPHYDSISELVNDLNRIYGSTLGGVVEKLQMDTPKEIVSVLQMMNRLPKAKGFWGETISVGSMMPQETGGYSIITDNKGNQQRIAHTRSKLDPMAAARPKMLPDEESSNPEDPKNRKLYTPLPGSAARNQIGPIMGQYRESVLIAETMKYINGGKTPSSMLFMQPVFDNLMLNSDSYLQTLHAANNIVLPEVLEWNLVQNIVSDFHKQRHEGIKELEGQKSVDIGVKSQIYSGITLTIDREMEYINKAIADKKQLYPQQKLFKAFMDSPANGYIKKGSERPDNYSITGQQAIKLVREVYNYKLTYLSFKEGKPSTATDKTILWENASKNARERQLHNVKQMARNGRIYFMN